MAGIITVSQLNTYIAARFKEDKQLSGIMIKGEISNFKHHSSGHCYFVLKDSQSELQAVMFKANAAGLKFKPADGMSVIAMGSVQVYEKTGRYQLYVTDMLPDGVGTLYEQFERLKASLSKEGLFNPERKKPLPPMPKKIGVVTAKGGAALQDVINILGRRYPIGEIVVFPVLVQGVDAPESVAKGIEAANRTDCDVLIVGRGGGSIEDLSAFNSEVVARAIYNSAIPIISAVGHETDTTIADFVADRRAPTPSAAAELAAPDIKTLIGAVDERTVRIKRELEAVFDAKYRELEGKIGRINALSPVKQLELSENKLKNAADKLSMLMNNIYSSKSADAKRADRLKMLMDNIYNSKVSELGRRMALLGTLNPLNILTRGYAAVYMDGKVVSKAESVSEGDEIKVRFADGEAAAEVKNVRIF